MPTILSIQYVIRYLTSESMNIEVRRPSKKKKKFGIPLTLMKQQYVLIHGYSKVPGIQDKRLSYHIKFIITELCLSSKFRRQFPDSNKGIHLTLL